MSSRSSAAKKREREEEDQYFERLNDFQDLNAQFPQVASKAVGYNNGNVPFCNWPTPDGGWEAKVERMLKLGFYPNGLVEFQADQFSPLHHAVFHNHKSMCEILITHGADVNLRSTFGDDDQPPLHEVESEAICKLLLDAGAHVNASGCGGETALMMAAARGHTTIVRRLLAAGADPTMYDTSGVSGMLRNGKGSIKGETAAKTARRYGHLSLANELDAAECSHPKRWVPPAEGPRSTEYYVQQIRDNRARLERIIKENPAPPANNAERLPELGGGAGYS